jgi:hypothetical protein
MGKATELSDYLQTHPLTPEEIRLRRAAEAISDPDTEVTLAGTFVKPPPKPAAAPTVTYQAPTRTWD